MADFQYITDQGVIVPDTADIRAGVESEWRAAFGQDLVVTPESPQGVIITTQVETRDGVARNNAELANQINPDQAGGIFLSGIWALTGGGRFPATRTTVANVIFGGVYQTIIPTGSIVTAEGSGEQFETVAPLIIGVSGTVTGDLRAVNTGPILAGVGELNGVGSNVLGWETVTNPVAGVPGVLEESDVASRTRRRLTLALNTISTPEAIISGLYNIQGVRSLAFRENIAKFDQTIDGIFMVANSIYVSIEGGTDQEIAATLVREKTLGAGYNGTEEVEYVDPSSGQTYTVKFDRPTDVQIFARVTVDSSPLDAQTLIPAIIQRYIAGEIDGGMGLTVGSSVSTFELAGVINQTEPRFFIRNLELSNDGGTTWTHNTINIGLDQVARLPTSSISVVTV